jgi:hypothetical protein
MQQNGEIIVDNDMQYYKARPRYHNMIVERMSHQMQIGNRMCAVVHETFCSY